MSLSCRLNYCFYTLRKVRCKVSLNATPVVPEQEDALIENLPEMDIADNDMADEDRP